MTLIDELILILILMNCLAYLNTFSVILIVIGSRKDQKIINE